MKTYQIKELSELAHISTRTLRYYDQIGLLSPRRYQSSKYRVYDHHDVDKLQHILFYKALGIELKEIKKLLNHKSVNRINILKEQLHDMIQKKNQLDYLILNLTQTIESIERNIEMTDKDKFKGFKEETIQANDNLYHDEVIEKWGKTDYEKSKQAMKNMTEDEFKAFMDLGEQIKKELKIASDQNLSYSSPQVQNIAKMHQTWLTTAWGTYDKDAHLSIVTMYEADERFKSYYDSEKEGLAHLLNQAVTYMLK